MDLPFLRINLTRFFSGTVESDVRVALHRGQCLFAHHMQLKGAISESDKLFFSQRKSILCDLYLR